VSAVIVNYRQWRNTAALVRQLSAQPAVRRGEVEVVVVDNHSPPHPLVSRLRRWPGVSLRRWRRNQGFGRAAREGARLSRGRWLLLLNPDVRVPPDFLAGILARVERLEAEQPRAGIVGFQLRHHDGSRQLSAGPFPTLINTLARLVLPRARRKYRPLASRRPCRVPWVSGCCLLVRGDCWRELEGFDRDFFLYYEDVDLCHRAQARGWAVWHDPTLRLIHHRPLHTRDVSAALRCLTRHGLLTYAARHWPGWHFRILARLVQLEAGWRRWWARWQGDARAADLFDVLKRLAGDFLQERRGAIRRRLRGIVDALEAHSERGTSVPRGKRRVAGASLPGTHIPRSPGDDPHDHSLDHHSQPQPTGPAASVPGHGRPPCSGRQRGDRGR
jgi:GT2 family glycosyltransferase